MQIVSKINSHRFLVFNGFLFLAGMGGMFFRMARDNDDLIRAVLILTAGASCTWILAAGRLKLSSAIAWPCLGWTLSVLLSSFATVNAPESLKEFSKIGTYMIVFLTLAASASQPAGGGPATRNWRIPAALAAAGALLGWIHTRGLLDIEAFPLWSDQQVIASIAATLMFAGAFAIVLARGTVRQAVLNGLGIMALTACALGILQFYGIDPLRPWDPRQPYNIYIRDIPANFLTFIESLTNGRLQRDTQGLVLVLPRILGIYGNPDFFAPYILQFIPIAVAIAIIDPARRKLGAITAALLLITLGLTQVWGAFISLVVLATFFVPMLGYVAGRLSWPRACRVAGTLFLTGVVLTSLLVWLLYSSGHKSSAIEERLVKYRMAVEMWKESPIVGVGLNAYKSWYPVIQQRVRFQHDLPFESLGSSFTQENRTHNDLAQMLAETGTIGTGLFLWFMSTIVYGGVMYLRRWRSIPVEERSVVRGRPGGTPEEGAVVCGRPGGTPEEGANACGLIGGVTVILIYSLPNFPFHIVSSAGTFWIMAGLLASYLSYTPAILPGKDPTPASDDATAPVPTPTLAVMSVLTVVLVTIAATRLFLGTLEYKRADNLARRARPRNPIGAAAKYERAIELDPSNAQYAYDYGAMCFNESTNLPSLGTRAEPLLRQALRLGFVNEDLAYGLGYIAEKAKDYAEALKWYNLATSLKERHDPSREGKIRILLQELDEAEKALVAGRYASARDLYTDALKKNPSNHLAAFKLGTLSVTPFGDTESGIRYLDAAARAAINEPTYYLALGRALFLSERLMEAERAIARSAMLDPANAEAAVALSRVRQMLAEPTAKPR